VQGGTVACTHELAECEHACKAVVGRVCAGLGKGERFVDASFTMGDQATLLYDPEHGPVKDTSMSAPAREARLLDWAKERTGRRKPSLWGRLDNVALCEPRQGKIGNCWLIAAVAEVATHRPDLISALFVAWDVERGVYGVRLWLNGAWEYIVVDDWVYLDGRGELLFASDASDPGALWVPVLEKAVAKAHRCWEALDSSNHLMGLEMLTGGVGLDRDHIIFSEGKWEGSGDKLWEACKAFLARGDVPSLRTPDTEEKLAERLERLETNTGANWLGLGGRGLSAGEAVSECGLDASHSYSLVGLAEVKGTKLFKFRDPRGYGGWVGAWSDGSAEMTEAAKAALGVTGEDDGVFYKSAAHVREVWEWLEVCRCFERGQWSVTSATGYSHRGSVYARCVEEHVAEESDELSLRVGDRVLVEDNTHPYWWFGHKVGGDGPKPGEEPKQAPAEKLELEDATGGAPRAYDLTLSWRDVPREGAEVVLVLVQPDKKLRGRLVWDEQQGRRVLDKTYGWLSLAWSRRVLAAGEECWEQLGKKSTDHRTVQAVVAAGPEPLRVTCGVHSGCGEKYTLLAYCEGADPVLTEVYVPRPGSGAAMAAFQRCDISGQGKVGRVELHRLFVELDVFPSLEWREQAAFLEQQLASADEDKDGKLSYEEFEAMYDRLLEPGELEAHHARVSKIR